LSRCRSFSHGGPVQPASSHRDLHKFPAYGSFPLQHLLVSHGLYVLPATKIQASAGTAGLFFPSGQHCSTGYTASADRDKNGCFLNSIHRTILQMSAERKSAPQVLPPRRWLPRQLLAQTLQYGLFLFAACFLE